MLNTIVSPAEKFAHQTTPIKNTSFLPVSSKPKENTLDHVLAIKLIPLINHVIELSTDPAEEISDDFKDYFISKVVSLTKCVLFPDNKNQFHEQYINISGAGKKTDEEDSLLKTIIDFIEHHLEDEDLCLNTICKSVCMSRTNLYNRIKQQTGKSISYFIKSIRLKKAAYLLVHEHLNVTEVMYQVGITSPSYFTRLFKNEFGIPPSVFAKEQIIEFV